MWTQGCCIYIVCVHVSLTLGCTVTRVDYLSIFATERSQVVMKEKIDALIKSVDSLKQTQAGDQQDLRRRLDQLEKDMAASQEEATQRVVKKLKENQTFSFKNKENETQYIFNDNVKDQLLSTGKHLDGIEATTSADRDALDKAKRELEQGLQLISARQKRIKVADQSEFGWATVDEYEQDTLAENEDDAKRLEKAEKVVSLKLAK